MATPAEQKAILSRLAGLRVTATDIGDALEISRNSANNRLQKGLDADDILQLAEKYGINPVEALIAFELIPISAVRSYIAPGSKQLSSASVEELVFKLAENTLSIADRIEMGATAKAYLTIQESQSEENDISSLKDDLAKRRVAEAPDEPDYDAIAEQINRGETKFAAQRATEPLEEHWP